MNGQITTYNSDFLSFSCDVYEVSPSSPAIFTMLPVNNLCININIPDSSNKILEFAYIIYQNHFFSLKTPLKCKMSYNKNLYFLTYDDLNLSVWASTRDELIDAFNFQFYSLYTNFALERDENLSVEAKNLKSKILDLISLVL